MGRYSGKTCRLLCMLSLTASFFFVEITVGFIINSLALVGDSYHMLSDVVALGVGFASVRISKWKSQKNTYGWARAEVLGALVNAVFLVALCFSIFVEALQRLAGDEHIHNPDMMLIVGALGLVINLIGLFLFHGHAHGHSHGGGGSHNHSHGGSKESKALTPKGAQSTVANGNIAGQDTGTDSEHHSSDEEEGDDANIRSSAQLNMRGVFLHVLGDALGSVIVIISALVIKFVKHDWAHKVDPAMSIVLVIIILSTSIPLLKESALILLQTVPIHIKVKDLQDKLISKVEGVLAVHEFHVWQLAGNRIIASAHIRCQNLQEYMQIAEKVKQFFHNEGIHSSTIQPEFVEFEEVEPGRDCVFECGPDKTCYTDTCCANGKKDKNGKLINPLEDGNTEGIRQRTSCSTNGSNHNSAEDVGASVIVDEAVDVTHI